MKKILIILVLIGTATLSSCEKTINTTWVYYDETYCSDPWGNSGVFEEEKKINVVKYFEEKNIKIYAIEVLYDGKKEECEACHCHSEIRIKCRVKKKNVKAMLNASFYQ